MRWSRPCRLDFLPPAKAALIRGRAGEQPAGFGVYPTCGPVWNQENSFSLILFHFLSLLSGMLHALPGLIGLEAE